MCANRGLVCTLENFPWRIEQWPWASNIGNTIRDFYTTFVVHMKHKHIYSILKTQEV
jgi:hypothetical protein